MPARARLLLHLDADHLSFPQPIDFLSFLHPAIRRCASSRARTSRKASSASRSPSGRIVDLATRSSECHVLQEALDCEEKVCLLIVSEQPRGDPETTLVDKHESHVWSKLGARVGETSPTGTWVRNEREGHSRRAGRRLLTASCSACASRRRDIFARRVIIVDPALSLTGSQLITSLLLRLTRTGAPPLQLHPRTHPHASPLQHRLKCFLALVCSSLSTLSHGELADRLRPHYGPARCTLRLRPWTHHHAAASVPRSSGSRTSIQTSFVLLSSEIHAYGEY